MNTNNFDIDKLRVASPCSVGWENMHGDDRVRRCDSCQLNIFNTAEMTSKEVEWLIGSYESRLCIRLHRRADGTVLTKDCPVGLMALRKRATRFAGATLAAILGLFSLSFGQKSGDEAQDQTKAKIVRSQTDQQESKISGAIIDMYGAVIPGAEIKLYRTGDKKPEKGTSNDKGVYLFSNLLDGVYKLEVKAFGFKAKKILGIKIGRFEKLTINVPMSVKDTTVTVGVIAEEPLLNTTSGSIGTVVTRRQITNLPIQK